jgi:hypothetical protein
MLRDRLGIDERFLGTGFAQPLGTEKYEEARIPEYLCPNNSESADNVITWELSPTDGYLKWTLEEIIKGERIRIDKGKQVTEKTQPKNSKDKRDRLLSNIEQSLDLTAKEPVVVRFQQLACSSGYVGREQAARVFFSHLGAIWKMKLEDAARLSGYTLDGSADKKFYIWVFLPRHVDEVVPATWKNIVKHVNDKRSPWIK